MYPDLIHAEKLSAVMNLSECEGIEEVRDVLIKICRRFGCDFVLYGGRFLLDATTKLDKVISNYPEPWRTRYEAQSYSNIDPTVSHALSSVAPLVWCESLFATDAQKQLRAESLAYGLTSGVTFPIHSRDGDVGCISFATCASREKAEETLVQLLPWGTLAAAIVHETMRKICKCNSRISPCLTPRELEVLQWIASGKSTWDISRLISLSEHGVLHHVRKLMKKFDVPTRQQAVVKARLLGLL